MTSYVEYYDNYTFPLLSFLWLDLYGMINIVKKHAFSAVVNNEVVSLSKWQLTDHLLMQEFIGPFWALRAALGPLVESYILLDRLLFLQEQGNSVEAFLFPIFDPTLSPRNIAVIARRKWCWMAYKGIFLSLKS